MKIRITLILLAFTSALSAAFIKEDINKDDFVDEKDMAYVTLHWGKRITWQNYHLSDYDVSGDNYIDTADYAQIINKWGSASPALIIKLDGGRVWGLIENRFSEFTLSWSDSSPWQQNEKSWLVQESWSPDFSVVRDSWVVRGAFYLKPQLYLSKAGEWGHVLYYRVKALHKHASLGANSPYPWSTVKRIELPNPIKYWYTNPYIWSDGSIHSYPQQ